MDVISSSGYYPIEDWERQLDRIEAVAAKYQKPFFFAEVGCMSVAGSKHVPNDWTVRGAADLAGQAAWYQGNVSRVQPAGLGERLCPLVMDRQAV